ncbi:hypothetical protein IEQ34_009407 [Dendrobium chrysotoxum]|uniref:Uncharacterized protein n=1 Tax=Dendrobium chrysotoxum TaxID=161865 RepID=A0AAV7GZ37_DENCH|nr:hypothetical protein IEQ34_009407 [Dendrobium chrysotoxum]
MSFSFFKPSRGRSSPAELVKAMRDSILALDTKTAAKALEDVEKNIISMRQMLSGDGEAEPSQDQISQMALEICKEDVLSLFVQKLPSLGWDARKDLVHCWGILLRQKVDSTYCCVEYIENHLDLLDFLVVCYNNKEIALNCGSMLRECIKYPTLANALSDMFWSQLALNYSSSMWNCQTLILLLMLFLHSRPDLLSKHETEVSQFLSDHYEQFFELYDKLLTSSNYVTKRQSLKDSSKNVQILAFHIFKVFVANPNKPREIKDILAKNHQELLMILHNLPVSKDEDEQFEEERDLIIKEIEKNSRLQSSSVSISS